MYRHSLPVSFYHASIIFSAPEIPSMWPTNNDIPSLSTYTYTSFTHYTLIHIHTHTQTVFEMGRTDFDGLAKWKKDGAKKKAGLF